MTGLWQVSGRGLLSVQESIDLDAEYAQRRSFTLDLVILARTLAVLTARRRRLTACRAAAAASCLLIPWRHADVNSYPKVISSISSSA